MKKYYITTPIYYVNSQPHIGHAYTTLMADILARFHRQLLGGDRVWFLTGTDEHGAKVEQAAKKNNVSPQKFCDEVSAKFQLAWDSLDISNNDFIRTTEKRHEDAVKNILNILKTKKTPLGHDIFFEKEYEGLYCVGCEAYLKEEDLENGLCPNHQTKPEAVSEKNWFFRLSDFRDIIVKKISKGELKILPEKRKNEVLGLLEGGLEDIAISRTKVEWGIKLPFDEKQTVYVWVEALMNYITALGYGSNDQKKFNNFWPADLQLLGKDILKFHAVIWPAILISLGLDLPDKLFVHGYLTIDGKKMSKTLGNTIDPMDLIDEYGLDAARYLIVSQFQFGEDGHIKAESFANKYNSDLANGIGNLTSRVLSMAEKYFDNVVPAPKDKKHEPFGMKKYWEKYLDCFKNLKIFDAVSLVNSLSKALDAFIAEKKPWELAKDEKNKTELAEAIYVSCETLRHIARMIYPIMPGAAGDIFSRLALKNELNEKLEKRMKWGGLKPGSKINKGEALFPRK